MAIIGRSFDVDLFLVNEGNMVMAGDTLPNVDVLINEGGIVGIKAHKSDASTANANIDAFLSSIRFPSLLSSNYKFP